MDNIKINEKKKQAKKVNPKKSIKKVKYNDKKSLKKKKVKKWTFKNSKTKQNIKKV